LALNKRKVLDSARKFAQKGAKAKALKEYQLLLQADPRDAKLLLEVGDAYRRWGQTEDAIAQYAKVAQQYRQDGFDARAVAVYKQILNLDPKHYAAYVSLSELYQRMGLDAEAIGALQTAADGYHREGRKTDALELLRQMAALDPTNTTSRLKVAELLRQEKMTAEALAEYEAAARELENQQDRDQLVAVRERILELKPDHLGALTGMVRTLMVAGKPDRAEPFALRALQVSAEPPQFELVIELFAQMGNDAKLAEATRTLAKLYRDRGDDDKARELMQRLPADEVGARSRLAVDVSEIGEPEIEDEELLEDDPFVTVSGTRPTAANDLGEDELELGDDEEIQLEGPKGGARPPVQPLEGDPDQLLAEASVYLRYGKRAQAIQRLRTVLDQDPNHRAALEKLGEAYADDGQNAEAVAIWLRAADQIKRTGDAKALAVLRDRIATLDPKAAARLIAVEPAAPVAAPVAELDLEVELELDEAVADHPAASGVVESVDVDIDEDTDLGFEVEIDDPGESFRVGADLTEEAVADEEGPSISLAEDGTFEFEIDPGEISHDADAAGEGFSAEQLGEELDLAAAALEAAGSTSPPGTTTTTARIREELEEAEFYIAQEMFDEAESILTRILEIAPNHPSALLRMGEVQVARGSAPEAAPAAEEVRTKAGRRVAGTSERDLGSTARFEDGFDLDSPDAPDDTSGSVVTIDDEVEASSDGTSGFSIEIDLEGDEGAEAISASDSGFGLDLALDTEADESTDPAESTSAPSLDAAEAETDPVSISASTVTIVVPPRPVGPARPPVPSATAPSSAPPVQVRPAPTPAPVLPPAPPQPLAPVLAAEGPAADVFDLREALADVFNEPEDSARGRAAGVVLSTVEDGFESIFSDFKKGVSATLDQGDYDTRYDLGIAYREMGLYADAIGEFKICLEAPTRRFDSLYLMGLCARDLERYGDAVHHLEQALALPDLPGDRLAGVFFDLALAQDLAGDRDRARANMRRVLELDPRFPNAAEKLAALERPADRTSASPAATGGSAPGFESFDDLFSEDESEEAMPVESFESFDDVVSDVEATPVEIRPEPVVVDGPSETAPPVDTNAQSGRKSARKKISFV
jgi:tetratricopeptide (TPR) repeat protein